MMEPIILEEFKYSLKDIKDLFNKYPVKKKQDLYLSQLDELYEVCNPSKSLQNEERKSKFFDEKLSPNSDIRGNWIYFPWNQYCVHILNEDDFFRLRTNRNKLLITDEEQETIYKSTVGILGLSIGSHLALNLCQQGISKSIKIADHDSIDTTNLNRIRGSLLDVTKGKVENVREKIHEINPYSKVLTYGKITEVNIHKFFRTSPAPQVIVEVIDDFKMKINLRIVARKNKTPVIMLSNVSDNIIIDVERYDLDSSLPLFNGLLGNLPEQILQNPETNPNDLAVAMVGKEFIPDRALASVSEIGQSLVGRPQLISTIATSSGIATYMIREILLGNKQIQGRRVIRLNDIFHKE